MTAENVLGQVLNQEPDFDSSCTLHNIKSDDIITAMKIYADDYHNEQTKWIPLSERLPLAYLSGDWDGLKSFPILAKDKDGKCFVAITYQGTMDGSEFCDWVDMNDCEIENIVSWQKIPD